MAPEHKEVFISILNMVCNKNQNIQKAIVIPIVDAIIARLFHVIKYHQVDAEVAVEPITREIFNAAYFLTQNDDYLVYTVESSAESFKCREWKGREWWNENIQLTNENIQLAKSEDAVDASKESFINKPFIFFLAVVFILFLYARS